MRIMIAHDDPSFLEPLAGALRRAGHEVEAFATSLAAWDALKRPSGADLLITRFRFSGPPNGVALAHHARSHHARIHVLFIGAPELRKHAEGLGLFLPRETPLVHMVETVAELDAP